MEPRYVADHFVPVALDTYFRGREEDIAFCKKIGAGGNHIVAATASGRKLGGKEMLRLRERELRGVVEEFRGLSDAERRPRLPPPKPATPGRGRRPRPEPPERGLIVRGYCTYLRRGEGGRIERSKEYYYKENPDRWAAETQSDMLWLTETEWRSLVPATPAVGDRHEVGGKIQKRFFSTIGIDYMEGSVNSLPTRETSMSLTVEKVGEKSLRLRLDGHGRLGAAFDAGRLRESDSRGCEVRVLGFLEYDRDKRAFKRLDIVGIGRAWGSKMNYVRKEIRLESEPWMYGIACELVTGRAPSDLIPPYNLLHYGGAGKYFEE